MSKSIKSIKSSAAVTAPAVTAPAVTAPAPVCHEAALAAATAAQKAGSGPFAVIWAYLGQLSPDALATTVGAKAVRNELKSLGINPTTVTCQVGRYLAAGGNRKIATAFGKTKAVGLAALASLSPAPATTEG